MQRDKVETKYSKFSLRYKIYKIIIEKNLAKTMKVSGQRTRGETTVEGLSWEALRFRPSSCQAANHFK